MTTISSNVFPSDYADLTHNFDYLDHLIPDTTHPQHDDAENIYKNMGRILLYHIQAENTINPLKAPTAALLLRENSMESYGFKLFFDMTFKLSPQLGGYARDLE